MVALLSFLILPHANFQNLSFGNQLRAVHPGRLAASRGGGDDDLQPTGHTSILVTGVILGIVLPIFLNTSYTINGGILQVRSGWIVRTDIPVASIKAIRPTNSILSSPALSVADRIEITYGKFDSVIVSPKERAEFIADLARLNPAIVVTV